MEIQRGSDPLSLFIRVSFKEEITHYHEDHIFITTVLLIIVSVVLTSFPRASAQNCLEPAKRAKA